MPLIKRYPNRKLYDTEAKRYVTLEELTHIIQAGQDVQVIDHESGEDLTNLTLTQIILEQEKRRPAGVAPRALLTGLIRAGGDTLTQVQRSLTATAGAVPPEAEATVEEQANRAVEQGRQMLDQFYLRLDERLADLLHLLNLPTTRDLQQLETRIEALAAKLDAVQQTDRDAANAGTETNLSPL